MAKLKKTKLTDPEHTGMEPAEEQIVTMPKTEAPAEENLEVITEDPPAPEETEPAEVAEPEPPKKKRKSKQKKQAESTVDSELLGLKQVQMHYINAFGYHFRKNGYTSKEKEAEIETFYRHAIEENAGKWPEVFKQQALAGVKCAACGSGQKLQDAAKVILQGIYQHAKANGYVNELTAARVSAFK